MTFAIEIAAPLLGGLLTGLLALGCVLWLGPRDGASSRLREGEVLAEPRQFRFRNGYLMEHSDNVSFLLPGPINRLSAWDDLGEALSDVNDGIAAAFAGLRDAGRPFRLTGEFGRDRLLILGLRDGEDVRITVTSAEERQTSVRIDLASLAAMESEIEMLAGGLDSSPQAAWALDEGGRVVWGNTAYLALVERCAGPDAAHGWPLHTLFSESPGPRVTAARRKTCDRRGEENWFEVSPPAAGPQGLRLLHAQSLDAVIKAEESLRTLLQTLTKSFAFLPTGLAIFDREGQLTLFNPSLMDLTGLDAAWLSRKPLLTDFFDALRDRRRMTEPRDYKAWRASLADLGRTEAGRTYIETWTLPSGITYRVTARPQGDGAITLMLEDVSADVTAQRSQKDAQGLMRDVLDVMDEGMIVFDSDGRRIATNAAAQEIWLGDGPDEQLPGTLDGCIAFWKTLTRPNPIWGEMRDVLRNPEGERASWSAPLRRTGDGADLDIRVAALPGRRLAIGFMPESRHSLRIAPSPQQEPTGEQHGELDVIPA